MLSDRQYNKLSALALFTSNPNSRVPVDITIKPVVAVFPGQIQVHWRFPKRNLRTVKTSLPLNFGTSSYTCLPKHDIGQSEKNSSHYKLTRDLNPNRLTCEPSSYDLGDNLILHPTGARSSGSARI